jgi:leucyl-tRNA synthetase
LDKIWKLQEKVNEKSDTKDVQSLLHKTIKKITEDIEHFKFNTAISQLMILVNKLQPQETIHTNTYKTLALLIAPFAPHMAEEIRCEIL